MSGSTPLPELVTRSGVGATLSPQQRDLLLYGRDEDLRARSEIRSARRHGVVGVGPTLEPLGTGPGLADQGGTVLRQRAVRLVGEERLSDAGLGKRIGQASRTKKTTETRTARRRLTSISTAPSRSQDEVDQLDEDEGHDDPPDAVDEDVASEDRSRAWTGRNRTPRKARGISATITRALKMTAESTADCGLCRCMTLSVLSCG